VTSRGTADFWRLYANAIIEANAAVKGVPNGSDSEIRVYLVKQSGNAGIKLDPADISEDDVKEFRESQMPYYQELAGGHITKEEYESNHDNKTTETQADEVSEQNTFTPITSRPVAACERDVSLARCRPNEETPVI